MMIIKTITINKIIDINKELSSWSAFSSFITNISCVYKLLSIPSSSVTTKDTVYVPTD